MQIFWEYLTKELYISTLLAMSAQKSDPFSGAAERIRGRNLLAGSGNSLGRQDGAGGFLVEEVQVVHVERNLDLRAGIGGGAGVNAGDDVAFLTSGGQVQVGLRAHLLGNFHVHVDGGVGVTHRGINAPLFQGVPQLHGTGKLGSNRPTDDTALRRIQHLVIVGRVGYLQIFLVLSALLICGEIRPLQVHTVKIRTVVIGVLCLFQGDEGFKQLLVGAGKGGGQNGGGTVLGMKGRRADKGLQRTVHIVVSTAAVLVHVNKTGGDILSGEIVNGVRAVILSSDTGVGDHAVFTADLAVLDHGVGEDQVSDKLLLHTAFHPH